MAAPQGKVTLLSNVITSNVFWCTTTKNPPLIAPVATSLSYILFTRDHWTKHTSNLNDHRRPTFAERRISRDDPFPSVPIALFHRSAVTRWYSPALVAKKQDSSNGNSQHEPHSPTGPQSRLRANRVVCNKQGVHWQEGGLTVTRQWLT